MYVHLGIFSLCFSLKIKQICAIKRILGPVTDAESGEVICISCGTVVSDKAIEIGPDWHCIWQL